uniref:DedD protein n=1 Tax=Candidatus Kentrum sp. FM TaxID=2126340 RepID=A0A450SA07_9GAMM|nr:MAG: DedD protein [Candidatus Kentron sp. FM]VFJ48894.1 MAG: DedD protein [Candidatus Kentron sp. FM]VFK08221.1 MAG: DedD protein [Candidatus Kentron sp. FM]
MEQQLKHRLIGATVLVSLGVIFIPIILSPPERANEMSIDVFSPLEHNTRRSRIRPAEEFEWPPAEEIADIEPERPVVPFSQTRPSTTKPVVKVTRQEVRARTPPPDTIAREKKVLPRDEPSKTALASAESESSKESALKAWAVQVGSFSEQRNALGLRDRLRAKGYRAFVKSIEADGNTRVFVGPTLRRDDALRAHEKLYSDLNIKGLVIRYSGGR